MKLLTELNSYKEALAEFSSSRLWELFDGNKEQFNIAHECVDRHINNKNEAIIIVNSDGKDEIISYKTLSQDSAKFAHWIKSQGIEPGERVAIMLEPSLAFYVALFGVIKSGAIAVPFFTLFGPDAVTLRVDDCKPKLLITSNEKKSICDDLKNIQICIFNEDHFDKINNFPAHFELNSKPNDLAVFQYTSGTTRELPEAVRHTHRTLVTLMVAALYGTGIRAGDRFMCPSSPAWGHGLWHGTFAPMALGLTIGTYSGKFSPDILLNGLISHSFTNISAAATHYRMMRTSSKIKNATKSELAELTSKLRLTKLSYTGEPIDEETEFFINTFFNLDACSIYGTTEIGVVLVNYPGYQDFIVKPKSLGKPTPGAILQVQDNDGEPLPINTIGNLMVNRKGAWLATKDLAQVDEDGYFYHAGRADDVIISAGWTISAREIENAVLKHKDILETAAIASSDPIRGQIIKSFVVSNRAGDSAFINEIQELVRNKLSQHTFPRMIEFVTELPKTPAGKVNRKILRERETSNNKSKNN